MLQSRGNEMTNQTTSIETKHLDYINKRYPNEIKQPTFKQITNKFPYLNLTPSEEQYVKRKSKILTELLGKKVSPSKVIRFLAFYDPYTDKLRLVFDRLEELNKENLTLKQQLSKKEVEND